MLDNQMLSYLMENSIETPNTWHNLSWRINNRLIAAQANIKSQIKYWQGKCWSSDRSIHQRFLELTVIDFYFLIIFFSNFNLMLVKNCDCILISFLKINTQTLKQCWIHICAMLRTGCYSQPICSLLDINTIPPYLFKYFWKQLSAGIRDKYHTVNNELSHSEYSRGDKQQGYRSIICR